MGTRGTSRKLRNASFTADTKKAGKLEMGQCRICSEPAPSDMFRTARLHLLFFPKQLLQLETQCQMLKPVVDSLVPATTDTDR